MSDNRDEVFSALSAWQKRMDTAAQLAAKNISIEVWSTARKNVHQETHKRGQPHIGPRDGEGPNYVTGNLFRNIIAKPPTRQGFGTYVATVESQAVYARALEEGNPNWTSGVKFPYMIPARDEVVKSGKAKMILTGYVRAAMGG